MATNMFPSLNPAPLGFDALAPEMDEGPDIEVQIENPDGVLVGMDGIEIDLMEIIAGDKSATTAVITDNSPQAVIFHIDANGSVTRA